jgi:surface polysaccharide O-acyltransferase-like enzyme
MSQNKLMFISTFFLFANGIVGGIFYSWIKFDVLGHSIGTGVTPGPAIIMLVASLFVLIAAVPLGATFYFLLRHSIDHKQIDLIKSVLYSYVGCSILYHLWVILALVLDPNSNT